MRKINITAPFHTRLAFVAAIALAVSVHTPAQILQAPSPQAALHAKEAALAVAQINLGYIKIAAPSDGAVGERQVRPGSVGFSRNRGIPFVSNTKWVQANYRETQLTNVKVGNPAEVRIDEYPGKVFYGKVVEIAPASGSRFALLPTDNATRQFHKSRGKNPGEDRV